MSPSMSSCTTRSAPACSGAPSTMTGAGRSRGATELVIPAADLTCDDGSEPDGLHSPLQEELSDFTFVYEPAIDGLLDPSGDVWLRLEPMGDASSGAVPGTWPQTTPEQIREAQRLADEGNPDYTWQVDTQSCWLPVRALTTTRRSCAGSSVSSSAGSRSSRTHTLGGTRRAGWWAPRSSGAHRAGRTPCTPTIPGPAGCASTIDGVGYETVSVDVAQPGVQGPSGIWVVTGWRTLPPFQQRTPPSEAGIDETSWTASLRPASPVREPEGTSMSSSITSRSCTPRAQGLLTSGPSSSA